MTSLGPEPQLHQAGKCVIRGFLAEGAQRASSRDRPGHEPRRKQECHSSLGAQGAVAEAGCARVPPRNSNLVPGGHRGPPPRDDCFCV